MNQGEVKCIVNGKDAKTLKSGEYFGESALLDGKPRNATIVVADGADKDTCRLFELLKEDCQNNFHID